MPRPMRPPQVFWLHVTKDRDGRLAAKFHGLRFESMNMILYINGLTNAPHEAEKVADEGWWDRLIGLL